MWCLQLVSVSLKWPKKSVNASLTIIYVGKFGRIAISSGTCYSLSQVEAASATPIKGVVLSEVEPYVLLKENFRLPSYQSRFTISDFTELLLSY